MWVLLAGPSASRPSPQSDTCRRRAEKAAVWQKVTLMHHRGTTGVSKRETHLQLALELAQRVGQRVEQGDEVRAAHAVEKRRDLAANEQTSKQTKQNDAQRDSGRPEIRRKPILHPITRNSRLGRAVGATARTLARTVTLRVFASPRAVSSPARGSPGADDAGVSPVPVQTWQGPSRIQQCTWAGAALAWGGGAHRTTCRGASSPLQGYSQGTR